MAHCDFAYTTESLNKINVKKKCPLISNVFDMIHGDNIFTKLDLRETYNFICIREGDEWNTALILVIDISSTLWCLSAYTRHQQLFEIF